MVDMKGNSLALERELNKLTKEKNRVSLTEFSRYLPLFRKDWNDEITADQYHILCEDWSKRVSIFDKVEIVRDYVDESGNYNVVFTLPPMFTRVNSLNDGNEKADTIVTIFDNALTRNSPLRTDVEEALDLIKKAVNVAQSATKDRLQHAVVEYHQIMDDLKDVLTTNEDKPKIEESFNTNDLDWE